MCAVQGIGPWTAHYVALRGLGEPDAFPGERPRPAQGARARGREAALRGRAAEARRALAPVAGLRRDPPLVVARLRLVRHAFLGALRAYRRLFLIVAPIYAAIILLSHTPVLPWIAAHMEPAMAAFALPGGAALVLVLGFAINIYAGLAACAGLCALAGTRDHARAHPRVHAQPAGRGRAAVQAVEARVAVDVDPHRGGTASRASCSGRSSRRRGRARRRSPAPKPSQHTLAHDLFIKGGTSLLQLFLILVPIVFLLEILQGVGALAQAAAAAPARAEVPRLRGGRVGGADRGSVLRARLRGGGDPRSRAGGGPRPRTRSGGSASRSCSATRSSRTRCCSRRCTPCCGRWWWCGSRSPWRRCSPSACLRPATEPRVSVPAP